MKRRTPEGILGNIFKMLAPRIGARVVVEPEWNVVGQIRFRNGSYSYFRYNTIDLNPMGASEIAADKDYANFFMKRLGYPTVPGKTFFSDAWCRAIGSHRDEKEAYAYAKKLGFPVYVKPNRGSQGSGVAKVYTKEIFFRAIREIFRKERVALVQSPVEGKDYRVVVLDGKVISAYERIPLHVIGDGISTVRRLFLAKQTRFAAAGRGTAIRIQDPRIGETLARQGLTMKSVIPKGRTAYLLSNANLSTGGDAVDVTHAIHPEFKALAATLTREMGLRLCGVDFIIDGTIADAPRAGHYWILEINSAPGLDHYVKSGKAQRTIVEDMYLKVLQALERTSKLR